MRGKGCDGPSLPQSHGLATFIAREQKASNTAFACGGGEVSYVGPLEND